MVIGLNSSTLHPYKAIGGSIVILFSIVISVFIVGLYWSTLLQGLINFFGSISICNFFSSILLDSESSDLDWCTTSLGAWSWINIVSCASPEEEFDDDV